MLKKAFISLRNLLHIATKNLQTLEATNAAVEKILTRAYILSSKLEIGRE